MKAGTLISALRVGRSLDNPTPYKWFGLACAIGGLLVSFLSGLAASRGWIDGAIQLDDAALIVSLITGPLFAVSAHSAVVTTERIGLPPTDNGVLVDRVADLQAGADAPAQSYRPSGHRDSSDEFWDGGFGGFSGD